MLVLDVVVRCCWSATNFVNFHAPYYGYIEVICVSEEICEKKSLSNFPVKKFSSSLSENVNYIEEIAERFQQSKATDEEKVVLS